jgi:hypothetical protein
MPKFRIVYSVDGEEQTAQVEGWRGIDEFLELLEVGTLYRLYHWRNDAWEFIQQSKTQAPKRPWGHEPFPD